jgi:ribosomal-protein-alanine N-acetyltransferase
MRFWDWLEPASSTITTAFVAALLEEVAIGKAHYWAICLGREDRVIGTCDPCEIDEHHRRAEVGFMVAREYWGKDYAFEAMHTVIEYAMRSKGIERFSARTHSTQAAPQHVGGSSHDLFGSIRFGHDCTDNDL